METPLFLNFIEVLRERLQGDELPLQVVLGPRQVGKTTTTLLMIDEFFKDSSRYVSADQIFNPSPNWLKEQWLAAQGEGKILFVDEI